MHSDYTLYHLFTILLKWRKHLLIATLLVGLLTAIVAFLLPNYYKATTSFYAANPDLATPAALGTDERTKYFYGTDEDNDRLFTIANSTKLMDFLIQKHRLYAHYGLDSSQVKAKSLVYDIFKSQYQTEKTKYEAIELSYEDINPTLAANIANDARIFIDTVAQGILKNSQRNLLNSQNLLIGNQEKISTALADSLDQLRIKYGIIEPNAQGKILTELFHENYTDLYIAEGKIEFYSQGSNNVDSLKKYQGIARGLRKAIAGLKSNISDMNSSLYTNRKLETEYNRMVDMLSIEKERQKAIVGTLTTPFKAIHVVDVAKVPVKKSRPKRSIIVLVSMLLTFVIGSFTVLFIENKRRV